MRQHGLRIAALVGLAVVLGAATSFCPASEPPEQTQRLKEEKPKPVSNEGDKANKIDNPDENLEPSTPEGFDPIGGGKFKIISKTFLPPLGKPFTTFPDGTWVDVERDPEGLTIDKNVENKNTAERIKVSATEAEAGTAGQFPMKCEGNLQGGGGAGPGTPPHWSAKISGFEIEVKCQHETDRKVNSGGTLEVVPALVGDTITMKLLPPSGSPAWTVNSIYGNDNYTGTTVTWDAHGYNAEGEALWLFDYIPKGYDITCQVEGETLSATVKAYPITKRSLSFNVGEYFNTAETVWNALPVSGVTVQWPDDGASISFENGWKERSIDNTAYLWFSGNANLNPLIGIEGRYNFLGGITPPSWIRDYVDIGLYAVASGSVGVVGTIERGESGVTGSIAATGTLSVGVEGILKAADLLEAKAEGSWDALVLTLGARPESGWVQWRGDLDTGAVTVTVSFRFLKYFQVEKNWDVWEGTNICHLSEGGDWQNLWQYDG